jgi:hypothetical protein
VSQSFDRFMVMVGIGTNRKLRRLPVVQRWTYVAGVLALAAQSPMRGALLITDGEPATAEDVAQEATVPLKDARAALASLRRLGMLTRDEHGIEWVHDWEAVNPDPKPSASPEAARKRKREQRARERAERERHAGVTPPKGVTSGVTSAKSHAPEEEGEGVHPPSVPPQAGGDVFPSRTSSMKGRRLERHQELVTSWVAEHFPSSPVAKVAALASHLQARGVAPTPAALRDYAERNPAWSLQPEREAA